jgi:hypothetical protein
MTLGETPAGHVDGLTKMIVCFWKKQLAILYLRAGSSWILTIVSLSAGRRQNSNRCHQQWTTKKRVQTNIRSGGPARAGWRLERSCHEGRRCQKEPYRPYISKVYTTNGIGTGCQGLQRSRSTRSWI